MGHSTDSENVSFLNIRNHRLYFRLQKKFFKVAHVMTNPGTYFEPQTQTSEIGV